MIYLKYYGEIMSNVIGPFDQADFRTMAQLKQAIAWFRQQNDVRYKRALKKEIALLRLFLRGEAA
jgi:hypothetical protein